MRVPIDLDTGKPERGYDLEYLEQIIKDLFELTEYLMDRGEEGIQHARAVSQVNSALFYGYADLAEGANDGSHEETEGE